MNIKSFFAKEEYATDFIVSTLDKLTDSRKKLVFLLNSHCDQKEGTVLKEYLETLIDDQLLEIENTIEKACKEWN